MVLTHPVYGHSLEESSKTHIGCKKPHKEKPVETTLTMWAGWSKQIRVRHRGCCSASLYKHLPGNPSLFLPTTYPSTHIFPFLNHQDPDPIWRYGTRMACDTQLQGATQPSISHISHGPEQMEMESLFASHALVLILLANLEKSASLWQLLLPAAMT